jgi:DNA polymerase
MLIASPGHVLYCADFSNIEARLAFWIAEHEEGLKAFRQGRKLYEEMASAAFDIPLESVTKDSIERFVGKESVLGCQYGMGWSKFLRNCHQKGVKQVTDDMAKKAVCTYREVHAPIPALWRSLEEGTIQAIANPKNSYRVKRLSVYVKNNFLHIQLPSQRKLRYYKPRLVNKLLASGRLVPEIRYMGMDFHEWKEVPIWGGTLTNHVVQGIARDLMVSAMMNTENAGYKTLLTVHDECLSERSIGLGSIEDYIKRFTKLPDWAQGLPLEATGWTGPRYKKG